MDFIKTITFPALLFLLASPCFADGYDPNAKAKVTKEDPTMVHSTVADMEDHPAAKNYHHYRYEKSRNESRYETSQGWSRGNRYGNFWWYGRGGRSDIPTAGYTKPVTK